MKFEDIYGRTVVLTTVAIQSDGSAGGDVKKVKLHFLDGRLTKVRWSPDGVTADYADGQVRP